MSKFTNSLFMTKNWCFVCHACTQSNWVHLLRLYSYRCQVREQYSTPIFRRDDRRRKDVRCFSERFCNNSYGNSSLEVVLREAFDDRVISRGLWPPHSPGLTPCDFYLWGGKNPHSGRTETLRDFNNFRRRTPQRVNNVFRRDTECIASGEQHFSICCSTGDFLLDFLNVNLTAIASIQLPSPNMHPPGTRASEHKRTSTRPPLLAQAGN
jgi:hypothetical protein